MLRGEAGLELFAYRSCNCTPPAYLNWAIGLLFGGNR